ncbi:MAG: hypothetical protein ACLTSZ_04645 [Lachnospiraceae bacterium]
MRSVPRKNCSILSDLLSDEENRSSEYRNRHYILTSDISLNDTSDYAGWSEAGPEYDWRPIGVAAAFGGVFDGNGHTISGLYINADMEDDNTADARKNGGLFAQIFGGTVKNLNLTEVYMKFQEMRWIQARLPVLHPRRRSATVPWTDW